MRTISIALCTCNGQAFLAAQWASLLTQTRLPDEVVIIDDGSHDATFAMMGDFATGAPFPVLLNRNPIRLGVGANFEQAIRLCTGDMIALCDQDDVWLPDKLSMLASAFNAFPDAAAVFSDAQVVDAELNPLGYTMWQQVGFTTSRLRLMLEDKPWKALFKDPVVTGATLMFRRELLPYILPIPEGWMHDAWIAQIAASQGGLVAINEPLVLYRQHTGNVIGGKRVSFFKQISRAEELGRSGLVERELKRYGALFERLVSFPSTPRRDAMLGMCEAKLEHLERRKHLPANRLLRWPTVLREWLNGNYSCFAKDWRNVAADLLMP